MVMRSVLNDCLRLVLVAAAVGLAGVIALRGTLPRIIFGMSPSSPLMLVAATALLISVALFTSYLPARRATRVDPVVALRYE
jgi:putative ABC transport system permease protein